MESYLILVILCDPLHMWLSICGISFFVSCKSMWDAKLLLFLLFMLQYEHRENRCEWMLFAQVVDRLFVLIYAVLTAILWTFVINHATSKIDDYKEIFAWHFTPNITWYECMQSWKINREKMHVGLLINYDIVLWSLVISFYWRYQR